MLSLHPTFGYDHLLKVPPITCYHYILPLLWLRPSTQGSTNNMLSLHPTFGYDHLLKVPPITCYHYILPLLWLRPSTQGSTNNMLSLHPTFGYDHLLKVPPITCYHYILPLLHINECSPELVCLDKHAPILRKQSETSLTDTVRIVQHQQNIVTKQNVILFNQTYGKIKNITIFYKH